MSLSSTQKALAAAASGSDRIPVLNAIRSDADTAAVLTKLTPSEQAPSYDKKGNRVIETPSIGALREQSLKVARRSQDVEHIFAMLPDLELVRQVLISSILAPRDLITTELNFNASDDIFQSDLRSSLISKIREYFKTSYKIKEYLYDILDRVLFTDGSYPVAVIPENAIDDLINSNSNFSMESLEDEFYPNGLMRPLGLLGPADVGQGEELTSLESLYNLDVSDTSSYDSSIHYPIKDGKSSHSTEPSNIVVTDNFNVLKRPLIEKRLRSRKVHSILGTSLESNRKKIESINDRELYNLLYKSRNRSNDVIRTIKTQDQLKRKSVSEPLIMRFPSESVIPVYVPGSPDHHVGYFVLLDMNSNPVTRESLGQFNGRLIQSAQSRPFVSSLIESTRSAMLGDFDCYSRMHQDLMVKTYADIIEADLMARLRNGSYSSSVRLASNQEIYRIMLTRELSNNRTQILWIPAEIMTYFASEYDRNGIGRSLVEKNSVIAALRSSMLFANVRAGIRNSVGRTIVEVTLDEEDIDPRKRMEEFIGEFMRSRQSAVPYAILNPTDLAEFIARAGYEITFSGHPSLPNMTIDTTEANSNFTKPDDELSESLRTQHHMGFGLTSEILDNMNQPEHAVTAVNQSILLTKRIIQHHETFNPLITDHLRKVIFASENLMLEMSELIRLNFDSVVLTDDLRKRSVKNSEVKEAIIGMVLRDFIDSLEVTLSKPLMTTITNQMEELDEYERMLDKKIDTYLDSDLFNDNFAGELGGQIDSLKNIIKQHFMRMKMSEMGLGEEVSEFFLSDSEDLSMDRVLTEHGSLVSKILVKFSKHLESVKNLRESATKVSDSLGLDESPSGDYDSDSSDEKFDDFSFDEGSEESEDDIQEGEDPFNF